MSSSSPNPDPKGTLIVELPHWAAVLRVSDNLYRPVPLATPTPQSSASGSYTLNASLPPGAYQVEVSLGRKVESTWVAIRPNKTTTIPAANWQDLQIPSAAPHAGSGPGTDKQLSAAERWSKQSTWAAAPGGASRLFVFARTDDPARNPRFAEGLWLLDADEKVLVELTAGAKTDLAKGWMAFNADLAPGFYILQRLRSGVRPRCQPLFLCQGWETQVFLNAQKYASLATLSLHMAAKGDGYRQNDEIAEASDAVLDAMQRNQAIASVVASGKLQTLLKGEHKNPWLGILACYALTAFENIAKWQHQTGTVGGSVNPDPGLRNGVLQYLESAIGDHPDVRALALHEGRSNQPKSARPMQFPHPPLLRAGLQLVRQRSKDNSEVVPLSSLTDRVLDHIVANSPWTAWRASVSKPMSSRPKTARAGGKSSQQPVQSQFVVPDFARSLPASAPIFRAAQPRQVVSSRTPPRVSSQDMLRDAALLGVATASLKLGAPLENYPESVKVNLSGEPLPPIDARAVSGASNIPLARVEAGLKRLSETDTTTPAKQKAEPNVATTTEQAIVRFALQDVEPAADLPQGEPPAASDDPGPASAAPANRGTLEGAVQKLRSEAERLQLASKDKSSKDESSKDKSSKDKSSKDTSSSQIQELSSRLRNVSNALLGCADVVAITDKEGRLLFGNGALALLAAQRAGRGADIELQSWWEAIAAKPAGRSQLSSPTASAGSDTWELQRTTIEDNKSQSPEAYLNILRANSDIKPIPDALAHIEPMLDELALHASFVAYGSQARREESLVKLHKIVKKLEKAVGLPPAASRSKQR